MYWFWGMNMFWWIFWIALLFITFAWWRPRITTRSDSAIDVLREKFAAGDITDEQYLHRLEVLAGPTVRKLPAKEQRVATASHP